MSPLLSCSLFFLPLLIHSFGIGQTAGVPIIYQSPLPHARYVTPQTNIIIRPDGMVDPASLGALMNVVGSVSGTHEGVLHLSDDGQTVVFIPAAPFIYGETVSVTMSPGLRTTNGAEVTSTRFVFHVMERVAPIRIFEYDPAVDYEAPTTPSHPLSFNESVVESRHATQRADTLPPDFPVIQTAMYGTPSPGKLFIANMVLSGTNISYLMILDDYGTPVFYRRTPGDAFDFKKQPNGLLSYGDLSVRAYYVMDASYTVVDSFRCGNGYPTDIHEFRMLPNGHVVLQSYDPQIVNMSKIVPGGDTAAIVYGLVIQELDLNKNVVFQWRSWDHFEITDATHINLTAHTIDYVHGNAIEIDTDGNFIISSRHMDELTKISRQTGQIIWRWGGRNNEFTVTNDTLGFSYQHAVRRIANGNITLFDNGNFHTPQFSRALEYSVDEVNKTATVVWQYRNTPDIYGRALGYVQRLPSGNTLIAWGAAVPTVMEVRPDGSKVSELWLSPPKYSYRAFRFEWNPTSVNAEPTIPGSVSLSQNYPNPFNPTTNIRFQIADFGLVSLKVFDVLGGEVATLVNGVKEAGEHSVTFDGSALGSGVYWYRLDVGRGTTVRKAILLK